MENTKYKFTELSQHSDPYFSSVNSYLQFLIDGDGNKSHCPFTKTMVTKKMFYYDASKSIISEKEFYSALYQMKLFIEMKYDRFAVVGVVYTDEANFTIETASRVEEYRQKYRLDLLRVGLTTAWTHPKNPLGTHTNKNKHNDPLWVSEVPMLMMRYIDSADRPFMVTQEAVNAFEVGLEHVEKLKQRNDSRHTEFFPGYFGSFGY